MASAGEALRGILLEAAKAQVFELRGNRRHELAGRPDGPVQVLVEVARQGARVERAPSGEHEVHQRAERVEVRARVNPFPGDLFRRHPGHGAQEFAVRGQLIVSDVGGHRLLGHAEVHQAGAAVGPDPYVSGGDITVYQPGRVDGGERTRHIRCDPAHRFPPIRGGLVLPHFDLYTQVSTRDQVHDEPVPSLPLARVEDRHDVGVVQAGE